MRRTFYFFSIGVIAWACTPEPQDLDVLLEERLASTSTTNSIAGYLLPDSEDLSAIPQDPNNPLTAEKVALGQLLYHETGIAVNPKYASNAGTYSCASCHHAAGGFQAGKAQGIAEGGMGFGQQGEGRDRNPEFPGDSLDVQPIRSPSVLNAAYQEVMLWNGQFGATGLNANTQASWTEGTPKFVNYLGYEGVETQAIAGLTVHRMGVNEDLFNSTEYRNLFDAAFAELPEDQRISMETMGLAIAAYERTVLANQAPFQQWLRGNHTALSESQKYGALLFFEKGGCYSCHNGPSLANMEFHALGMNDLAEGGTYGPGVDVATEYGRGGFTGLAEDNYTFKVPQLYGLAYSPFYGHGGNFTSVREVIEYKNIAVAQHPEVTTGQLSEHFVPLSLTEEEVDQLTDFVLNGLNDTHLERYEPTALPSGNCFPNNDAQSRADLGCN